MTGLFGLFRLDPQGPPPDLALGRVLARGGRELRSHHGTSSAVFLEGGEGSLHEEPELCVAVVGRPSTLAALRTELEEGGEVSGLNEAGLLAAAFRRWGEDCMDRLSGPFAAAILDRSRHGCLIFGDEFGRWPLFVRINEREIAFSTRLTPMLEAGVFPRILDPDAATAYFRYGLVPGPMTLLRGIRALGPGARLIASRDGARIRPGAIRLDAPDDVTDLETHYRRTTELLRARVRRAFEGRSDLVMPLRPSLEEQLLLRLLPPRTRSLGAELPEGDGAARAAQLADRSHAELKLQPDADGLDRVFGAFEQPLAGEAGFRADAALRWAKRNGAQVVDGTGGAAIFAADPRYPEILVQDAIRRSLPRRLQRMGGRSLGSRLLGTTEEDLFPAGPGLQFLSEDFRLGLSPEPALGERTDGTVASLQQLDFEQRTGTGQAPLRWALAQLHSVGWSMPFLDRELVTAVGKWPLRARTEGPEAGVGVRHLGRLLFGGFALEPTQPGGSAADAWLRGPLREPAETVFFGRNGGVSGILHPRRLRRLWYGHQLGRSSGRVLLGLLMFEWACHRLFERTR
ncbi:MAG: asparagine synthase-related protein [Myxococcota bacterium]